MVLEHLVQSNLHYKATTNLPIIEGKNAKILTVLPISSNPLLLKEIFWYLYCLTRPISHAFKKENL